MWRIIPILGLVLSLGCADGPSAPSIPNLGGSWTYSVTNLAAPSFYGVCTVSGTSLSIDQSGDTFNGAYAGGTLSCTNGYSAPFGGGTVTGWAKSDGWVRFDFVSSDFGSASGEWDWSNTGMLSGDSMSGTADVCCIVIYCEFFCSTESLTGNWAASR